MNDKFLESEETQQFFGLVQMLQRSALVAMGHMPNHEGNHSVNIHEAKAAIDIIAVLHKLTSGNLEDSESNFLPGIITELKMQFVAAPQNIAQKEAEEENADELKKTFTDPSEAPAEVLTSEEE